MQKQLFVSGTQHLSNPDMTTPSPISTRPFHRHAVQVNRESANEKSSTCHVLNPRRSANHTKVRWSNTMNRYTQQYSGLIQTICPIYFAKYNFAPIY